VFVMTRGGPGSATELISIYIQRIGFRSFDQGMASAEAIVLLILTIILSRIYIRFIYREVCTIQHCGGQSSAPLSPQMAGRSFDPPAFDHSDLRLSLLLDDSHFAKESAGYPV